MFEHANGQTESRTTDEAQSYMILTNRNGNELRFEYDVLRRRTSFSYEDGDANRACKYEYKGNSRLVSMAAGEGAGQQLDTVTVDYDLNFMITNTKIKGILSNQHFFYLA